MRADRVDEVDSLGGRAADQCLAALAGAYRANLGDDGLALGRLGVARPGGLNQRHRLSFNGFRLDGLNASHPVDGTDALLVCRERALVGAADHDVGRGELAAEALSLDLSCNATRRTG